MRTPVLCTIEHLFLPCLDRPSYSTHTRPQKSRAYTRTRLVPSRADRPYGAFPRGHHEVAPDPGVQHPPERTRIRTALRRVLPWTAALAAPALLVAISMAPAPREADIQPPPTHRRNSRRRRSETRRACGSAMTRSSSVTRSTSLGRYRPA